MEKISVVTVPDNYTNPVYVAIAFGVFIAILTAVFIVSLVKDISKIEQMEEYKAKLMEGDGKNDEWFNE